jgi:hypothetical protein
LCEKFIFKSFIGGCRAATACPVLLEAIKDLRMDFGLAGAVKCIGALLADKFVLLLSDVGVAGLAVKWGHLWYLHISGRSSILNKNIILIMMYILASSLSKFG